MKRILGVLLLVWLIVSGALAWNYCFGDDAIVIASTFLLIAIAVFLSGIVVAAIVTFAITLIKDE